MSIYHKTVNRPFNYQNLFIYLFLYLGKCYYSLITLILPVIFLNLFCYFLYIVVFAQNI